MAAEFSELVGTGAGTGTGEGAGVRSGLAGRAAAKAAQGWHPASLVLAICFWTALPGNLPLWRALHRLGMLDGRAGALLGTSMAVTILALLAALMSLFAWRGTLKPALAVLLVVQALGAHYMLTYNVVIDTTMMTNVLLTDRREVVDLIGWPLWRDLGWLLAPPLLLLWRVRLRPMAAGRALRANALLLVSMLALAAVAILAGFQPIASTSRNNKSLRYLVNPISGLVAVGKLAAAPLARPPGPLQLVGTDAVLGARGAAAAQAGRPPLFVLVLGETARADRLGLNGYARDTTPGLSREPVASFRDVRSCGTSTAASVPCMFSPLGREGFAKRDADHENLLDVLQHAGLAVLWVDNQAGGCKGVCDRVPNVSTVGSRNAALCADGDCHDEILLEGLDERIAALPAERRARGVVVVLHTMGSHGPAYFKRSRPDEKRFLPECDSIDLQRCTHESLQNAYDNSIVATDAFLVRTIRWLEAHTAQQAPALLYLSDHGESLGEHNVYLHGLPYSIAPPEQKQVPWITWLSPGFAARSGLSTACLTRQATLPLSHDNLFHSVLGLLDVETRAYQPALDAYAACARG